MGDNDISISLEGTIKKFTKDEAGHVAYLVTHGWTFEGNDVISKHGGVTQSSLRVAAAFQDFLNVQNKNIEDKNITELIQMRAKTPEIWEAAMWEKYTDVCLNQATEQLAEEIINE